MIKVLICLLLVVLAPVEKVLFIGDSLTAYQYGWQQKLSEEKNYQSVNTAVSGKRTDWMLGILGESIKTNHYDKIFIYGGINDIVGNYKAEVPLRNIRHMISICKMHNIEPIIITGYNSEIIRVLRMRNKGFEKTIRYEYKRLQDSLMTINNTKVIPPALLLQTDTNDGIHLNSTGQKKFSEWIIKNM